MNSDRLFPAPTASSDGGRWFLLDLIKALGCVIIVWHHLAVYSPMFDSVMTLAPAPWAALYNHGQLAVQAFLVVGGFLCAAQLLRTAPETPQGLQSSVSLLRLVLKRFLRLVIPLLAALVFTMWVTALVRPFYPHVSLSAAPGIWSLVVHSLMLQDLLGVPALSAGIWYVAIDFQLFAMAVVCVGLAGQLQRWQPRWHGRGLIVLLWLVLSALSLFWWNRQGQLDVQGLYFFGAYGLGMLAWRIRLSRITAKGWVIVFVLGLLALWLEPRWRMGLAWALALVLAAWPHTYRAPNSAVLPNFFQATVANLAQKSYSVFLTHFAVSLLVSAAWTQLGWRDPWADLAVMCASFALSLVVGVLFYRWVESRTATWTRWMRWQAVFGLSGLVIMALS